MAVVSVPLELVSAGPDRPALPVANYRLPTAWIITALASLRGLSWVASGLAISQIGPHPLAAVALMPSFVFITSAGSRVWVVALASVVVVRLSIATPLQYLLGQRIAYHAARPPRFFARQRHYLQRCYARLIELSSRHTWTLLLLVLLSPTGSTMIAAGACQLRPGRLAMANLAGKIWRVLAVLYIGTMLPHF